MCTIVYLVFRSLLNEYTGGASMYKTEGSMETKYNIQILPSRSLKFSLKDNV